MPDGKPPLRLKPAVATPTIFAAGIFVKFAAVNAGNVPVTLAAGTFVKFAADIAGSVPVIFAAGTLVKFAADIAGSVPLKFAAGKLVRFAPLPVNVVAVHTPVKNMSPSSLAVTPVPTFKVETVVIPDISTPVGDNVIVPTPV